MKWYVSSHSHVIVDEWRFSRLHIIYNIIIFILFRSVLLPFHTVASVIWKCFSPDDNMEYYFDTIFFFFRTLTCFRQLSTLLILLQFYRLFFHNFVSSISEVISQSGVWFSLGFHFHFSVTGLSLGFNFSIFLIIKIMFEYRRFFKRDILINTWIDYKEKSHF